MVWLKVGVPVHPKGVQWGSGQGSVQTSQDLPHQTENKSIHLSSTAYPQGRGAEKKCYEMLNNLNITLVLNVSLCITK